MVEDTGKIKSAPDQEIVNHNESILKLYDQGKDILQIARELKLGMGEVKLVVDLYKGAR